MSEFIDQTLIDSTGTDVGKITDVIPDPVDLSPRYLVVRVGRLGGEHLVPAEMVDSEDGRLVTPIVKELVRSAPRVHAHVEPSSGERAELCRHYGLAS